MSVKFCVLTGAWPVSCGKCAHSQILGEDRLKIAESKHRVEAITEDYLIQMRDGFDRGPDNANKWVWRLRTKWAAGCYPQVTAINFSPVDPTTAQDLYIERLQPHESLDQKYIYYHQVAQCRFLLPVKEATSIFNLSNMSIDDSVKNFQEELRMPIGDILNRFMQDRLSNGLAITLKSGTFVWLK
jgi:hypothetical protein